VARFALNTMLTIYEDYYTTYLNRLDSVTADDVARGREAFTEAG